jgi:spermidine synthase
MDKATGQNQGPSLETFKKKSSSLGKRGLIYCLFFFSGVASLIYEILWSRQFVLVFGNSSYAISIVLAAFMAGLGLGGLWLGRRADRVKDRLLLYSSLEGGIALLALILPLLLELLKKFMPLLLSSAAESLFLSSVVRFSFSFLILLLPCLLIGGTLPVLSRYCIDELKFVSRRISLLYGLNTLGAATGCFLAGFYLLERLGLSKTNLCAVSLNGLIALAVLSLRFLPGKKKEKEVGVQAEIKNREEKRKIKQEQKLITSPAAEAGNYKLLFLAIAFISGLVSLSLEVLWTRYLSFRIASNAYSFASILGVFLLGLGVGSLLYRLILASRKRQALIAAASLFLSGPLTLAMLFAASKLVIAHGLNLPPFNFIRISGPGWEKWQNLNFSAAAIFLPSLSMGIIFPSVCTVFAQDIKNVGENIGRVYALNTAGSIIGSLLPTFVTIPFIGLRSSLIFFAFLLSASGMGIFFSLQKRISKPFRLALAPPLFLVLIILSLLIIPKNLTKELFLSTLQLGKHNEVISYDEGKTATSILVQDRVSKLKDLYINSTEEVPTSFSAQYCFKLMGTLGVLLHPQPQEVLMVCFGGGIAAGTTAQHPEVKKIEIVDIEASVIKAAKLLAQENNNLLQSPKIRVIVEDGRNYLFISRKKYPLIVSDSTHPKSADSWVLYTQEFYKIVKQKLTANGIFIQWLPFHEMTVQEFKIILKTFQSVFPHTSLWLTHAFDEMGRYMKFSLLAATPQPLTIDFPSLQRKLSDPIVQNDLRPWCFDSPLSLLENFLANEDKIRKWVKDVPLNRDDLPWSYFHTRFSSGEKYSLQSFLPLAENVRPYVQNIDGGEADKIKAELDLRYQSKRLVLQGRIKEAFALLPDDKKILKEKENIESSLRYLEEVSKFYPDNPRQLSWLAEGLRPLLSLSEKNKENGIKALETILEKAVKADPLLFEAQLELAEMMLKAGKRERAAELCRQVLKSEPNSFDALFLLANILSEGGKTSEAVEYFEKALGIDSSSARAHNNLAAILIQTGKIDEALEHLERALALNRENAEIHNNFGAALLQKGKIEEAALHFQKALEIDPGFWKAKANLADICLQKGDYEKGIPLYSQALSLEPKDAQTRVSLAAALLKKSRYSEAIALLREGLKISPDQAAMLDLLARLMLSNPGSTAGDREQALALAQKACALTQEKNPIYLDTLAACYASSGNLAQAKSVARQAYSLALSLNLRALAEDINRRWKLK